MFTVIHKKSPHHTTRPDEKLPKSVRKNELLLTTCFVIGLIVGVWLLRGHSSLREKCGTLFENYLYVKKSQTIPARYFTALCLRVFPLVGVYMTGLCAVGKPFLYAAPAAGGIMVGMVSGYLYGSYALKGIGYCALILFPGAVGSMAMLIYACAASTQMSARILKNLSPKGQMSETNFRLYSVQYLILLGVSAALTVLDVLLYQIFNGYFQFS